MRAHPEARPRLRNLVKTSWLPAVAAGTDATYWCVAFYLTFARYKPHC